jgi:arylformamidase
MDMDDRFANGAYIPNGAEYPAKWARLAADFRNTAKADLDVRYGPSDRQLMDVFHPEGTPKGTVVFVHGGYWVAFDKSYWSHLAAGPLAHGWSVAMPSYDLCPDVHISEIAQQIEAAVRRLQGPLRLTGHSAGGHLVARLTGMPHVARVLPISPVADLMPLLQTKMNADLRLSEAEAFAESPVNLPPPNVPVTVWVGGDERPVFQEQAKQLSDAWGVDLVTSAGAHHFNVIEPLADPESPLVKALLS